MKPTQFEWVKSELEWVFYELNKFWVYFYINNSFYDLSMNFSINSSLGTLFWQSPGFLHKIAGPNCNSFQQARVAGYFQASSRTL
jgi:hypothetical protein